MQGDTSSPASSTDNHVHHQAGIGLASLSPDTQGPQQSVNAHHNVTASILQQGANLQHRHGASTPWDPQNLSIQRESHSGPGRPSPAKTLLQMLGDFPVNNREDGTKAVDSKEKTVQEPLWLLAGLADRGWDVGEANGDQEGLIQPGETLHHAFLTPELESVLRKWTPEALQNGQRDQACYFEQGVYASKCDVAPALDPVHHGIVTEFRAYQLFERYA